MNLRNDFDLDFMRFDPFQGREPWNEPDQEPEDRICELCDQVLATDEKEICEPCAEICAADDAAHAKEDELKNTLKNHDHAQRDPDPAHAGDRR